MSVDAKTFRDALGRFASGVCVVTTAAADGRPVGVTISSFASLSLDPPLVLFCIGERSVNLDAYLAAERLSINLLAEEQTELSETFAAQNRDKFAGVAGETGENGCFRIAGALVTLECRRRAVHRQGDHHIVVCLLDRITPGTGVRPLLRYRGAYRRLAADL